MRPSRALSRWGRERRWARALVRRGVVPVGAVAVLLLVAAVAAARPGGGQSFGGGSSGGSSSGGGGGGGDCGAMIDIALFLIELNIEHPEIGIPVDIALVVGFIAYLAYSSRDRKEKDWSTKTAAAARSHVTGGRPAVVRKALFTAVSRTDPDFSLVLFEDFVYALFTAVHDARGKRRTALLAPYLNEAVLERLQASAGGEVRSVAIGALRYAGMLPPDGGERVAVTLEFEANYTELERTGAAQAYYVVERWTLSRSREARSRKPASAQVIGCPNCGAPLDKIFESKCSFCSKIVHPGVFDWVVDAREELEKTPRPPQLTGDTEERGTGLPTVTDPDVSDRFQALARKDPSFTWQVLSSRLALIFAELQVAWSTLEWDKARPFVSDPLFQMLSYWIETYRRAGMRNVSEKARITHLMIASVISDRYYDAVTVRVFATGLDYTITNDGKVVSGSRTQERRYTEYWTLIRGTGAKTPKGTGKECPNCGAPLEVHMTGNCTSCGVKVTSGEFDWVLSRIEQDEAYG